MKAGSHRYYKARVFLQGDEEPIVEPSIDEERIVIVGGPYKNPSYNYKVYNEEDIPETILKKLRV